MAESFRAKLAVRPLYPQFSFETTSWAIVFSIVFVKRCVPETKGRTLETLEAELRARFS